VKCQGTPEEGNDSLKGIDPRGGFFIGSQRPRAGEGEDLNGYTAAGGGRLGEKRLTCESEWGGRMGGTREGATKKRAEKEIGAKVDRKGGVTGRGDLDDNS